MRRWRIAVGVLISVLFFGVLFPVVFWLVAEWLDSVLGLPESPISAPVSRILAGMTWSLGLFWVFWSYSYLVFVGGGSPVEAFGLALEPTRRLVTAGPYAYVRNPMVFGLLLILFGVAFLANSISGLVLAPVVGLLAAMYLRLFEEKELVRRFGVYYEHYREHVPMLIPRPNPYVEQAV